MKAGIQKTSTIVLLLILSGTVLAADSNSLERVASYSFNGGVAYVDDKNPALFHVYTADQPDITKSRADASYVYGKIDVVFKDNDLVPTASVPLGTKDITDQFSGPEDLEISALDHVDHGLKVYMLFKGLKVDEKTTVDVTVQRYEDVQIMSHLIVHRGGCTKSYDYEYALIRDVFPISTASGQSYVGVISDACGNGGCTSTIEVLKLE